MISIRSKNKIFISSLQYKRSVHIEMSEIC